MKHLYQVNGGFTFRLPTPEVLLGSTSRGHSHLSTCVTSYYCRRSVCVDTHVNLVHLSLPLGRNHGFTNGITELPHLRVGSNQFVHSLHLSWIC